MIFHRSLNEMKPIERTKKKGAQIKATFLKQEIKDFGEGFDDFLRDITDYDIIFKKVDAIFFMEEEKIKKLASKQRVYLSKLFKRGLIEYPEFEFKSFWSSLKDTNFRENNDEIKENEELKKIGLEEDIRDKIAKIFIIIIHRVDPKKLEEYDEFFEKLINACLIENI